MMVLIQTDVILLSLESISNLYIDFLSDKCDNV